MTLNFSISNNLLDILKFFILCYGFFFFFLLYFSFNFISYLSKRNSGLFVFFVQFFYQIFAIFFSHSRNCHPNLPPLIYHTNSEIGFNNRFFYLFYYILVPRGNGNTLPVSHINSSHPIKRRSHAISTDNYRIKYIWICSTGSK